MSSLPSEDRITAHLGEMVRYIRSLYPMRFYQGEKWWTLYASAAVLRMADMADAVIAHMPARRDQEATAALRNLYELVVTLVWVLGDPDTRKANWEGEALIQQLRLHNDLANFGETLLDPPEIAAGQSATGLPSLVDRAKECDDHWSSRVSGLHGVGHLLSFRGLYNAIYRLGSQSTHASIASLGPYIGQESNRFIIAPPSRPETTLPYALVAPLLAMALAILATEVKWIDADTVREINDRATASD
jgi:Family of unknown function (DUF5677)